MDLSAAFHTLDQMTRETIALLPNLVIACVVFAVFWLLASGVSTGVRSVLRKAHRPLSVALIFSRLAGWLVLALGTMVAVTIVVPSMSASSLLGALGVGGVAIGFAFKDIFQNLLAGLLLLITRPFQIGDVIVSGNHEGTVEDIQVRATLVRTYDNRLVVVPNSDLYTNRVIVISAKPERRGQINVGIGYGEDIEHAKRLILDAVRQLPEIEKKPEPVVLATELGDSSVNLVVRYWVGPNTGRNLVLATDAVIVAVKKVLDQAGVEIAYPTQTLHLRPADPAAPGSQDDDTALAQRLAVAQPARV